MPAIASRTVAVIGARCRRSRCGAGACSPRIAAWFRAGHPTRRDVGLHGYTPERESDLMGLDPMRQIVHSSLYASLRTNLPREVMGFRAFPFSSSQKSGRDARRFPGHAEVLEYLKDFADEFGLRDLVRFGSEVCHVRMMEDHKWMVSYDWGDDREDDKVYDAVVVCNGHFTEPRIAEIPAGVFSGQILFPTINEMMADVEGFYSSMEASGIAKRFTHRICDLQFEYNDWLARQSGSPPTKEWRKPMYLVASRKKLSAPETYHDE